MQLEAKGFWYTDANPLVRCCTSQTKGKALWKLELNLLQRSTGSCSSGLSSALYSHSVRVSYSSGLNSIIWGPDDEQSVGIKGPQQIHKITPDFLIHAIKTINHTAETKYVRGNTTCDWNYTSSRWNIAWFTIYKVHQMNFSVTVNVTQPNILDCDSRKLMKASDIS